MANEEQTAASAGKEPKTTERHTRGHISDMAVMEHTASIWRYRPITEDGTELHSEYHAKYSKAGKAEIIAARARGKKHKHEGTNCDDWFETAVSDDCIICVLSDGAGSRKLSRIGARVCCETAAEFLTKGLKIILTQNPDIKSDLSGDMSGEKFMAACGKMAPLIKGAAKCAYEAVEKKSEELAGDESCVKVLGRKPGVSDLASTFLAAVIIPLEEERFVVSAQIGDGCICALDTSADAGHCLKLLGEADSGAFSGETDFLSAKNTEKNAISAKTRISRGKSDIIMLMSDGVADDYFPAAPMIKRLYLDLCLNGIFPMKGDATVAEDPSPIRFKSVSLSGRSVELQYAKQLLGDGKDDVDILWQKRESLRCHSLEAFGITLGKEPQERLLTWLDNYNERGSFDDRTLITVNFGGSAEKEEQDEQR